MTENGHILIVDDQQEICDVVQEYLTGEGYRVSTAHDGAGMRRVLAQGPVDLVILDLMLPGEDGLTLARSLRSELGIGIIILTGRGETVDRIIGLEMGADDYLPKPFHLRELLARVKAVLRRAHDRTAETPHSLRSRVRFAGWNLDLSSRELLSPSGDEVRLTTGEFDLLSAFRQQCQSGAVARSAARSGAQPRSRAVRSHDRRAGRPAPPQARGRSAEPDADQDGARQRLHLHADRRDELRPRPRRSTRVRPRRMTATILGAASAAIWVYLIALRGGFWRIRVEPAPALPPPRAVTAVIPARDEAAVIGRAVSSLLAQRYTGPFDLVIVDDHSTDGTAEIARAAAAAAGALDRLTIIRADPVPAGWTGKLWAVRHGIEAARAREPDYLLLTDADIVHAPDNVAQLVARAEGGGYDLVSLMVKLHCRTFWERLLIPAFVVFLLQALSAAACRRPGAAHRGRGRRVHADPPRHARPDRRHRQHPSRDHR